MRFFVLLAISLAIFGLSAAQGYTPIQWNSNNVHLVSFLNYGIAQATTAAQLNGQLPGQWYWTDVTSLESQFNSGSGTTDYAFIVDIANFDRDTATIMVIVTVASDGTESLKNYAIM